MSYRKDDLATLAEVAACVYPGLLCSETSDSQTLIFTAQ
jgi:hypothetical protein